MSKVKQSKISCCRICNSTALKEVIRIEKMPFTDEFITKDFIGTEFLADIEIAVCLNCGSAQNMHDTDMDAYYNEYTYTVQSSGFAINFMKLLAGRIKENYFKNNTEPKILEIGSGSGEQLLEFQKEGFKTLGIEPSEKLSDYANTIGIKTLTTFFDENTTGILDNDFKTFDAVVTSYTFDHIPRPVEVLKNIHSILNENGILIIEVHNLELIRKRNEFCLFEHEHYTYLNENTMTSLLAENKFEMLTYNLLSNDEKRANSLLVVARKSENKIQHQVNVQEEINLLSHLNSEINKSIERIDQWLIRNSDKKIVAYGAGGRGIMTIAALKNFQNFSYIVDKNPKATNIYAPKSHLPVFNIDELGKNKADIILIFSFGYYNEIVNELHNKFGYNANQFISILELLES